MFTTEDNEDDRHFTFVPGSNNSYRLDDAKESGDKQISEKKTTFSDSIAKMFGWIGILSFYLLLFMVAIYVIENKIVPGF
jgi:hypothetical protein